MLKTPSNIDSYIQSYNPAIQKQLEQLRSIIHKACPTAIETISYKMPAFKLNEVVVYFAAAKNHIGFYPTAQPIIHFEKEIQKYKHSKGAIQFPLDKPLPNRLITQIVKYRISQIEEKYNTKKQNHVENQQENDAVSKHIQKLDETIKPTVEYLRTLILNTDKNIATHIKWNNPSFYYTGKMKPFNPKEYKQYIIVFNLHKNRIMLVFPSGAKLLDTSGLLQGKYQDGRRTMVFANMKDVILHEKKLKALIKKWISLVEK